MGAPENEQRRAGSERRVGKPYKFFKIICFLIYTYCIYQSYVFSIAIVELFLKWDWLSWGLVKQGLDIFFILPFKFFDIIVFSSYFFHLFPFLAVYFGFLYLWIRRQTIVRAWLLALSGQFSSLVEFMPASWFGDDGPRHPGVDLGMMGVEIFYFLLFLADLVQREYFPHNKMANRVRAILSWPCIRT